MLSSPANGWIEFEIRYDVTAMEFLASL